MAPNIESQTTDTRRQDGERNVSLLVEFNRQQTEIGYGPVGAHPVTSVGIVGAGVMGTSIAAATVKHKLPVVITDVDEHAVDDVPARIAAKLIDDDSSPGTQRRPAIDQFIRATTDIAAAADCDLVLETVVEDLSVKRQLLAELEPKLGGRAVLASNTSTIPIARLAAPLAQPGRFCGIHFFLPVGERPLVEIIRGPQTSDRTIATAAAYARAIGQIPLVVDDGPGFLVNRLMLPYLSEALLMLSEGARIEAIERAAIDFGMALGPVTLLDEIGLDTVLNSAWALAGTSDDLVVHSPLLVAMVKAGRLGRKSGTGFFSYAQQEGRAAPGSPDPAVDEIIARWALPPQRHSSETITARLILPILLEATRLLGEKRAGDPRSIDLAVLLGFGFPRSRGGLLYWADTLGAARIVEMLRPLQFLGPRAQPTPMLLEMARENRRFYDPTLRI